MNKRKIFNDPVYGFITIPFDIIYDLISHPYFQRLRRIKQLGLTDYVYPGAFHTRFHHAIGALHLMQQAIQVLRAKNVAISDEEYEAVCIAILLHDIGHTPFSHALENTFCPYDHEVLSLKIMHLLNREFDGKLELAIAIFSGQYEKAFLHQLVSSQLDMDRMDYLTRDSFFTGVAEGVIGYDRIIKMLTVFDGELVVEEKGILSIERFLLSRYFMYSQVYLHRTVIAAEQMLKKFLYLLSDFNDISENSALFKIWRGNNLDDGELIQFFAEIDDFDIISLLKKAKNSEENILSFFADGLLNRRLFKTIYRKSSFSSDFVTELRQNVVRKFQTIRNAEHLVLEGTEQNTSYIKEKDEIKIFTKSNGVVRFSDLAKYVQLTDENTIFFVCHPPFN